MTNKKSNKFKFTTFMDTLRKGFYIPTNIPLNLNIEVTNRCNLNCQMCPRDKFSSALGDMTFDEYKFIVDQIDFQYIGIAGWGEPLLNKNICEMVEYSIKRGSKVHINSNATLLNTSYSERLIKANLASLAISVDSLKGNQHNFHTFFSIKDNIKRFIDIRNRFNYRYPKVIMDISVAKENIEEVSLLINEGEKLQADAIFVKPVYELHNHGLTLLTFEDIKELESMLIQYSKNHKLEIIFRAARNNSQVSNQMKFIRKIRDFTFTAPCYYLVSTIYVSRDLEVSPCCHLPEVKWGSLKENKIMELWKEINKSGKNKVRYLANFCNDCYLNTYNFYQRKWN